MDRNAGTMLVCVLLGGVVMYCGTNVRLRVEPIAAPDAKAPAVAPVVAPSAEPGELPEALTNKARPGGKARPGRVQPAAYTEADAADAMPATKVTQVKEQVEDLTVKDVVWKVTSPTDARYLMRRKPVLVFDQALTADQWITIDPVGPMSFATSDRSGVTLKDNTVTIDFDQTQQLADLKGEVVVKVYEKGAMAPAKNAVPVITQRLRVPSKLGDNDPRINVSQYRASSHIAFKTVTAGQKELAETVFTTTQKGTYLNLSGTKPTGGTVNFVARIGTAPISPLRTEPGEQPPPSGWDYLIRDLVLQPSVKATIATRHEFNNGEHVYAPQFFLVTAETVIEKLAKPTIVVEKRAGAPANDKVTTQTATLFLTNTPNIKVTVSDVDANATDVVLYVDGKPSIQTGKGTKEFAVTLTAGRDHVLRAAAVRGEVSSEPVAQADVQFATLGPTVVSVAAPGFGTGTGKEIITVQFRGEVLDPATLTVGDSTKNLELRLDDGTTNGKPITPTEILAAYSPVTKIATLTYSSKDIIPGRYKLIIRNKKADGTEGIRDVFGNALLGPKGVDTSDNVEAPVLAFGEQALPSQSAGVTLQTGPAVHYPIYMKPPAYPEGFNPSDRVETRVARLYYYRDAHRVAQLINRSVKSYNAATVDVRRRAADRVRDDADKIRDERKQLEFLSVKAAQEARGAEAELNNAQNRVATARGTATQARADLNLKKAELEDAKNLKRPPQEIARLQAEVETIERALISSDSAERQGPADVATAQAKVAAKRDAEAKAVESWMVKEFEERRIRESQFRIEVAAAKEDPDTYAPGDLNSDDPVMRVSVSVIGEGLIQIRGPIKGLNVIRTMVNQIDAPVGQVRVSVHTLQVNGERADRMEKVVANIQRYLDHSRFLTAQSGQMLRNAVTSVAARKAAEAAATLAPGCTQWDRDQRYLYSFFGKDFTDELTQIDSEFLKTGNKLLALNSMDSTSLSSALFLLALAKNDVRTEIIQVFLASVQSELPVAEWGYYTAGISQAKHCDACKDKKEYLLAYNSKFQSFIGFFTAQVAGADTLNPLQREFIKLSQIFKAQMVTEMQLRQRVMERALLEERINVNYLDELRKAKAAEDDAKKELAKVQEVLQTSSAEAFLKLQEILIKLEEWEAVTGDIVTILNAITEVYDAGVVPPNTMQSKDTKTKTTSVTIVRSGNAFDYPVPDELFKTFERAELIADQFVYSSPDKKTIYQLFKNFMNELRADRRLSPIDRTLLGQLLPQFADLLKREAASAKSQVRAITDNLTGERPDPARAQALYKAFRDDLLGKLEAGKGYREEAVQLFNTTTAVFVKLAGAVVNQQVAAKRARDARRPLDEKKLLDLLVDEMEDKYVEILEAMRAHTSNVDNYLKSVTTALDDDFNTQYYLPSFRRAREASRFWDVTLAQIETTSVLTNNRSLGKVSPAATFEFDLPKRDILITEGFKSAKALFDEYGALMNDPSFLALAKIYSGNPVSMMQGGGGGLSSVRSVLPGLPTSPDEKILAQAGPGQKQFGSALDGLIPDPAIYKFETGTGYEVRPVLSPDGQAVVFGFDYLYTTDVREPVRADEKHLGRVKRHFVHTDVQLGNFELREVSKYMVSIKVARTGKGVQLLQDIPGVGILFRPLPSAGASLQQNLIYSQATIFPTLFDLMGLRYAPAVADLDPLADRMSEFAARYRRLDVEQRIYDIGATRVDDALRTPYGERRYDFYRPQVSLPFRHPNGYIGPGLRLHDGVLREGYDATTTFPDTRFAPGTSPEGRPKPYNQTPQYGPPGFDTPRTIPQSPYGVPGTVPHTTTVPGLGHVGVGKPVPYTPSFSTMPPAPRPTELPGTSQPPVITPGYAPPTPLPAYPPLAPVRP